MRKLYLLLAIAMALGLSSAVSAAEGDEVTVELESYNDSGVTGTVVFADNGDGTTEVLVDAPNAPAGRWPAQVHKGDCRKTGAVVAKLRPVEGGESRTESVDVALREVLAQDHYVSMHLKGQGLDTAVACAEVKALSSTPKTGGGARAGEGGGLAPWGLASLLALVALGAGVGRSARIRAS